MPESAGPHIGARLGVEDQNGSIGAGLVPQGVTPLGGVLADQPQKDGARELVLELQPRAPPDIYRASVAAPSHILQPIEPVDPQLVGRSPIECQLEPGDVSAGPLVEVFIPAPQEENVAREVGELRSVERENVIQVGDGGPAGKRQRIETATGSGKLQRIIGVHIGRITERLGKKRGTELPATLQAGVGIEVELLILNTLPVHEALIFPGAVERHVPGKALDQAALLAIECQAVTETGVHDSWPRDKPAAGAKVLGDAIYGVSGPEGPTVAYQACRPERAGLGAALPPGSTPRQLRLRAVYLAEHQPRVRTGHPVVVVAI